LAPEIGRITIERVEKSGCSLPVKFTACFTGYCQSVPQHVRPMESSAGMGVSV
jgi:hypothetical protein